MEQENGEKYYDFKALDKNPKVSWWSIAKNVFIIGLSFFLFVLGTLIIWAATVKIPDTTDFTDRILTQSTKIYDRTGNTLLYNTNENVRRTIIPIDQVPKYARDATVAIEDSRFYEHHGIDPKAIFRAIFVNIGSFGYAQGGSTITQQVAKNTFLSPEKTITRKLKEWILAIKIESVLSKEKILELYFNETSYGGSLYGIEEASQAFFGKPAKDLTLGESAYLAALPQAPSYFSPSGYHRDELEKRKNTVLDRMVELGYITQKEHDDAIKEKVVFKPVEGRGIKAPHFVFMVQQYLEEKYGKEAVENGGLKVTSTLDWDLQKSAQEIVSKYGAENVTKFRANNAATVGVDPKTGQILVLVGSRDYFNTDIDGNFNVAIAPNRQPGSSFKPFVYATAFMKGYTPDTIVFDLPTEFNTSCTPYSKPKTPDTKPDECYSPENYDHIWRGPMTMRDALAQSVNVPAVQTFYLAGVRNSMTTAQKMGITSLGDYRRYGLSLVLGSGEVSLLEMTGAYGVFANEGVKNTPNYILKVEDADGNVLEEYKPNTEEVLPAETARQISSVLSDNAARAPAFGQTSALNFPDRQVAVKTGTTNDYRDAWIIGYTPSFALGSWVGNTNNTPMEKKVAGFIVAPMWNAIMQEALKKFPVETFTPPVPTPQDIKPILRGVWAAGTTGGAVDAHSILYWVNKDDPRGPIPANPESDPQYDLWETPVRDWINKASTQGGLPALSLAKQGASQSVAGTIAIMAPAEGQTFHPNESVLVLAEPRGANPLVKVDFFVNQTTLETKTSAPWTTSFIPAQIEDFKPNNTNTIRAIGYDSAGNQSQAQLNIKVSE